MKIFVSIFISCLLFTSSISAAESVRVPSDPSSTYKIVVKDVGRARSALVVISERKGRSGISYAIREVNCLTRKFRYLSKGDTLDEALSRVKSSNSMSSLVTGSISYYIVSAACD